MDSIFKKIEKLFNKSWMVVEDHDQSKKCINCVLLSKSKHVEPSKDFTLDPCELCQLSKKLQNKMKEEFNSKIIPQIIKIIYEKMGGVNNKDDSDYKDCQMHLVEIRNNIFGYNKQINDLVEINEWYKEELNLEKQNRRELIKQVDELTQMVNVLSRRKPVNQGGVN